MTATPESPSSPSPPPPPPPCPPPYPYFYPPEDDGIELTWILRAWWKRRLGIAKIVALVTLLGILYALYLPNVYTSTTTLVVPASSDGGSSIKKMVAAAGMGGMMSFGGTAETYVEILKSRRVADTIIAKFDLQNLWEKGTRDDTVAELGTRSSFEVATDADVLKISYSEPSPYRFAKLSSMLGLLAADAEAPPAAFAASVARTYADELNGLIVTLGVTAAERERDFLQTRVAEARSAMEKAEGKLAAYKQNTAVAPVAQASATLQALGQLQGRLIGLRASQEALRATLSARHPEVLTLTAQIEALENQVTTMAEKLPAEEASAGLTATASPRPGSTRLSPRVGGTLLPLYMLPTLEREYAALVREAVIQATVYTALLEQYEHSRIMAARDVAPLKLLDAANVPQLKSKPRRSTMVILAAFLGAMLAFGWALAAEAHASGAWRAIVEDEPQGS